MSERQMNQNAISLQAMQDEDAYTIDLIELMYRLLGSWKLIACCAIIGAVLMGAYTIFLVTPQYEAQSTIYVIGNGDSAINLSDLQLGSALTKDYVRVFDMWEVHEEVITKLDLPYTYKQMRSMLEVSNTSDTRMIDIIITSPDPEEAAKMANTYAQVASQFIANTMSTDKPNIMSVALTPTNPVSPSKVKNIALGFIIGGVLAAGIIVLQMLMDDKIKTADDITKYIGLTNLAVVPVDDIDDDQQYHRSAKARRSV